MHVHSPIYSSGHKPLAASFRSLFFLDKGYMYKPRSAATASSPLYLIMNTAQAGADAHNAGSLICRRWVFPCFILLFAASQGKEDVSEIVENSDSQAFSCKD